MSDIEVMNEVLARLNSPHRIVPGTLIGPDIAHMLMLIINRIEQLESEMRRHWGE